MTANRFVLKHHRIEVDYTMGGNPSFTALTYRDGATTKTFKGSEVMRTDTALGLLVSVALRDGHVPGAGSDMFGFFLPDIDVDLGKTVKFNTIGVHAIWPGPVHPPVVTKLNSVELHGTAQSVMVADAELAPA